MIITRNVDLSVGSVLGLTAFATGKLFVDHPGLPIPLVDAGRRARSARRAALVNGVLVASAGCRRWWSRSARSTSSAASTTSGPTGKQINAADMPPAFLHLGTGTVLGVPVLALIAVVVLVVAGYYLRSYRGGRELYAIGSDPDAAGSPASRSAGGCSSRSSSAARSPGWPASLYAARFGTLDADAGTGQELNVVAAVVVGGVAIFGGSGTVWGAALGAVLLTTIGARCRCSASTRSGSGPSSAR